MKIKTYKLGATIPVGSYANIQPSIEIEDATLDEARGVAISHLKEMFNQYSDVSLKAKNTAEVVTIQSFNEKDVVIQFDPVNHKYYHEGVELLSATNYLKKFVPEFNAEAISCKVSDAWGIPPEQIEKMWQSNGNIASAFGTLVHNALEHINLYGVSDKSLPKHPTLKGIIEGFIKVSKDDGKKVYSEVVVTDVKNKRCGTIDRLVEQEDGTFEIADFKINVGVEDVSPKSKLKAPYNTLPSNKLSKFAVQMSYYADILESSGKKVASLVAYVNDGEWKRYEINRVEIIKQNND